MNESRKVIAVIAAATLSAALTLCSYRSSIYAGLPWGWQGVDYREQGQQFDDWFILGQEQLLGSYTILWVVSAALGGVALGALITHCTSIFSRVGCAGFIWPVFVMPLIGWFGFLSPLLAWGTAVFPLAVLIQTARRRARFPDLLTVPFYCVLFLCMHAFERDWFSVYGD
jgi:hypothetical protein